MASKKFRATFVLDVDEENNILSSHDIYHNEDIKDLVEKLVFDIDDVKVCCINIREHE